VLDTNVVLDWRLFRDPAVRALGQALDRGHVRWHATAEMLDEMDAVLARPFGSAWEARRRQVLERRPQALATLAPAPANTDAILRCADPDDQKFLDLALHLPARWLVTRDQALLKLRRRASLRGLIVVAPGQWTASQAA
jgi:predicted nucleic acid-binding protein